MLKSGQVEQIKMMLSFVGLAGLIFMAKTDNLYFFVIKTAQRCSHVAYKMLMRRALMIFLQSRLRFVENALHYMNPRQGAYGLSL